MHKITLDATKNCESLEKLHNQQNKKLEMELHELRNQISDCLQCDTFVKKNNNLIKAIATLQQQNDKQAEQIDRLYQIIEAAINPKPSKTDNQ